MERKYWVVVADGYQRTEFPQGQHKEAVTLRDQIRQSGQKGAADLAAADFDESVYASGRGY